MKGRLGRGGGGDGHYDDRKRSSIGASRSSPPARQLLLSVPRWMLRVVCVALHAVNLHTDQNGGGPGGGQGGRAGVFAKGFSTQMSVTVVDTQYGKLRGVLTTLPGRSLPQVIRLFVK